MTWVEEFRPKTYEEVKGQNEALSKLLTFLRNFKTGKKAIILHGSAGTGKTTLAHVIASENQAEIFELNASDLRNKDKLQKVLKPAIEQRSLTNKTKIILIDEVDGISKDDWGGLTELTNLIRKTPYPIIMTANDIWDKKFSTLRRISELIQMKPLDPLTTKDILIKILNKKNQFIENEILTRISTNSNGDLRSAINDLQATATNQQEHENARNIETDIFKALRTIFKEEPNNEMLSIYDSVNMPIDEIILWVEENIPEEYKGEPLAKALHSLSKADLFKGRIYKQQYWRFLVYENIFLSYGISSAKDEKNPAFTNYKRPTRILKIWLNNQKTAKKKTIAQKFARYTHIAEKRALNEFSIIKMIIQKNPKIKAELKLDDSEIEYLNKF